VSSFPFGHFFSTPHVTSPHLTSSHLTSLFRLFFYSHLTSHLSSYNIIITITITITITIIFTIIPYHFVTALRSVDWVECEIVRNARSACKRFSGELRDRQKEVKSREKLPVRGSCSHQHVLTHWQLLPALYLLLSVPQLVA
jgi:hypothetical protein